MPRVTPLTETRWTDMVLTYARLCGFKVVHFRPARTSRGWRTAVQGDGVGWPDVFAVHPKTGRVLAAELKVGRGKVTPEQRAWLDWLAAAGVEVHVWRGPDDWDQVEEALTTNRGAL